MARKQVSGQVAQWRSGRGKASSRLQSYSLEPATIFAEIEARPPLMREEAKAKYLGKQVRWMLMFLDGRRDQEGEAHLTFHFNSEDVRMVSGNVPLPRYPRLRSMQPGEFLCVRGAIRKIDSLCIELEIHDFVFAKAAEAARCPPRRL